MSDISKIKVSGVEYGIKDIQAREDLGNLGTRVTELEQHGGGGGGGSVQPDWNQNDSTAADYVKNRPFYTGNPVETVLVEESTVSFEDNGGVYIGELPQELSAIVGETYTVYWDGTAYECVCIESNGALLFGNLSIIGAGPDTGEPFSYVSSINMIYTLDTSASHTISISGAVAPITKIDKKYIDVLDKFIVHDNATITLAEANSYQAKISSKEATYFVWCGIIFDSINLLIDNDTHILYLYTNNTEKVVNQNSDGVFSISDLSGNKISFSLTNGSTAASPELSLLKDNPVQIRPAKMYDSSTSDTLLKIVKNGSKLGQDMEVLGDGTVKAYSIILPSSTPNSTKKFKITVDDSGTISATEVTA